LSSTTALIQIKQYGDKALSFTEVVEQVADNAEDVYQNDADEYLSGPEEESIESETENTRSAAYGLMRRALETRI
jgi:hypothetical protein